MTEERREGWQRRGERDERGKEGEDDRGEEKGMTEERKGGDGRGGEKGMTERGGGKM